MCNVAAPAAGMPACFAFDQVVTLFHEMGHCLHHMLTGVAESAISGTNGIEWDAIEFPSQFMEHFCWDPEVVSTLSAHVDTGEPLPDAMFERMLAARHFNQGIEMAPSDRAVDARYRFAFRRINRISQFNAKHDA